VRGLESGAVLRIAEGARLTPLAADIISEKRIEIVRRGSRRGSKASKLVAIGADHGGFRMKEELKSLLGELGHRVHDFGTNSEDAVDYPDFAHAVARAVSDGSSEVGIIIDGAGVGSAMTANKVPEFELPLVTLWLLRAIRVSTMMPMCSRLVVRQSAVLRCVKLLLPGWQQKSAKNVIEKESLRLRQLNASISVKSKLVVPEVLSRDFVAQVQ